jgi:RNA polymerase sigma-70 factor (ECF subfamily)
LSDEPELIEAYLCGEPSAVRAIDEWIVPVIRHRAWRLTDQDQDLCQDVRLKLLARLRDGSFRGESSLKSYVQAVAKYTCLDALRRSRIRRAEPLTAEPSVPSRDDPMESLSQKESERLCHRVLDALPEPCRELFRLVLERELSYEAIAEQLSLSLGTVKSRLARCRDRAVGLRRRMLGDQSAPGGHRMTHERDAS